MTADVPSSTPADELSPGRPPASQPPIVPWYEDSLIWLRWLQARPWAAVALAASFAILALFFGWVHLFTRGRLSTFGWAWEAWNPETNSEHAKLIPFIVLFLLWHAQPRLRAAKVGSSKWGLAIMGFGVLLYLASARALQARLALMALPVLLFGWVLYVWGPGTARVVRFPIAFLLFMIPLPGVEQATVRLQIIATQMANLVCNLAGIHLQADGTTLRAADSSFQFEIAGGCSGIHSLMAITMLTAIFVHLTQDRLWKKLVLFGLSAVFAIIGNVARISSVMMVAKFCGQKFAGGTFHDMSAWIVSFPFAFISMYFASKLVNWQPSPQQRDRWFGKAPVIADSPGRAVGPTAAGNVKYDY